MGELFRDFIPDPASAVARSKRDKLIGPAEPLGPKGPVQVRLPMGRDFVPGEKVSEIEARLADQTKKLAEDVMAGRKTKYETAQAKARAILSDKSAKLTPEERAALKATVDTPWTSVVEKETAQVLKEIEARLRSND